MSTAVASGVEPESAPEAPGRRVGFWWGVAVATAVGLALRWTWILGVRPLCAAGAPETDGCFYIAGTNDAHYVHGVGRLIAEGHWFKDPFVFAQTGHLRESAGKPPLYPAFLGFLSWFGSPGAAVGSAVVLALLAVVAWALARHWLPEGWSRFAPLAVVVVGVGAALLWALDGGSPTVHRLVSSTLGTSAVPLAALVARRLFSDRAALLTAALVALHPALWVNDLLLTVESLYTPLLCLVLLAAYRFWDRPTLGRGLALAVALGAAALTRAEALLLYGLVALPLAAFARGLRPLEKVTRLAVMALCALVLIGPWVAWNMSRFEQTGITAISTGAGSVLSGGSCDATYYGPNTGYWSICLLPPLTATVDASHDGERIADFAQFVLDVEGDEGERLVEAEGVVVDGEVVTDPDLAVRRGQSVAVDLVELRELPDGRVVDVLDDSETDRIVRAEAVDYISSHTRRLPVVLAARVGRELGLYRPLHQIDQEVLVEARGRVESWINLLLLYVTAPLGVLACLELRRRRLPISPFVGPLVAVLFTTAASFALWRYRLPVDLALAILVGGGLEAVRRRIGASGPATSTVEGEPAQPEETR